MAKKKVFVSFDFDNDKKLKDFIVGQSRLPDSPFEIIDTSLKEAAPMKTYTRGHPILKSPKTIFSRSKIIFPSASKSTLLSGGLLTVEESSILSL